MATIATAGMVAVMAAAGMGFAAACGIDLTGTAEPEAGASSTGSGGDGAIDGGALPTACATLDVSCLGALPSIWKPIALGGPSCSAGFTAAALVTNPSAGSGACACGACRPVNSFTCTGTTAISGGDNCGDSPIANARSGVCTPARAQHLEGAPPKATGMVTCLAPNDAGSGATADPLTACIPTSCSAEFCGGSSRCVVAEGERACPSGFTLRAHAGVAADPGCPPCACNAGPPGTCTGTVTGYESNNCGAGGTVKTYAVGTCNDFGSNDYNSVLVKLVPPDASCSPVPPKAAVVPDASLVAAKTICCQ